MLVQIALLAGIAALGLSSPVHALAVFALLALFVAFSSASQDIVIDAYRTDLLKEEERGAGAAVSTTASRIGALISGGIGLILADHLGWRNTYLLMAGLMVIGMAGTLFAPEPETKVLGPRNMHEAVWGPFKDFFSRHGAVALLVAVIFYKLGDAYAESLSSVFLLRGLHFSLTEVGEINKILGTVATITGAAIGGSFMVRLGLFRSLLSFGVLQLVSILSFMALALAGKSYPLMAFAVTFEKLCGGMGTAAFVAFLMSLCNKRFTATQYALFSSLAALGRVFFSSILRVHSRVGGVGQFLSLCRHSSASRALPHLFPQRGDHGDDRERPRHGSVSEEAPVALPSEGVPTAKPSEARCERGGSAGFAVRGC